MPYGTQDDLLKMIPEPELVELTTEGRRIFRLRRR